MKRSFCLTGQSVMVCILLFYSSVLSSAADRQTVSTTCRFDPPGLVSGTNGYTQVSVAGCVSSIIAGRPQLPFRTVRLLLPPEAGANSITVSALVETVILEVPQPLEYGHNPVPAGNRIAVHEVKPDPAVYQSTNAFPALSAELASVQRLDGYNIAIVRVFPLRYEPVPGRLIFTPALRVDIALSYIRHSAEIALTARQDQRQVSAIVDNPETLKAYSTATSITGNSSSQMEGSSTCDYLLITASTLLSYFAPLVSYRASQGLAVQTETVQNITNSFAGRDSAEKIRNYIHYAYTNWGVKYVLLGGDVGVVPVRGVYARCSGQELTSMPSDLYYACLDGSWNGNSNSVWGEPTDGDTGGDVDLLAEVIVGRAPVDTQAEVENFVAKTLAAESNTVSRSHALLAGEYLNVMFSQGGNSLDTLLPAVSNSHSIATWLDDRPDTVPAWTTADAVRNLSTSPLLVAHYGHTDDATLMRMTAADLDSLSNALPFFLYSAGCDAGWFDNFAPPDCIGEEFIKYNRQGAFAAVLNVRLGWFDWDSEWLYSGEYQRCFFNGILTGGRSLLGVAHQLARQDMIGSVETSGLNMPYRWCYFGLVLLGDPCSAIQVPITLTLRPESDASTSVIEWNSQSNAMYAVFRTMDLKGSNVVCLASNQPALSPLNIYSNAVNGIARAFYYVRETR
ncbi:MAG: C25 family cysteine peptidase [bacterium]